MVADYVKETNNHVLYRITPIYTDENLLADGVLMEAESVEDKGKGISYCVYVYNVQPGIKIDYETGDSSAKNASNKMSSGSSSKSSGNTYHSISQKAYFHTEPFRTKFRKKELTSLTRTRTNFTNRTAGA